MKRLLVLLCVLFGAFYAHARLSFMEHKVTAWLLDHNTKSMSGDTTACEDYAQDMVVNLEADGRRGKWEVDGGRDEMCGYLKQSAAVFMVLQATMNSEFEDVSIVRDGFPWMNARVSYKQRTTIQAENIPTMTISSEDTLVLGRTLNGFTIKSVESRSTGGI